MIDITLHGHTYVAQAKIEKYQSTGAPALYLIDSEDGQVLTVVSVNLLRHPAPAPGCIWVKTWSENEGLLEQLVKAGLLEPTGRTATVGIAAKAVEARLLPVSDTELAAELEQAIREALGDMR